MSLGVELLTGFVHSRTFILRFADIADRILAEKRQSRFYIEVPAAAEDAPNGILIVQLRSRRQNKPAIIAG